MNALETLWSQDTSFHHASHRHLLDVVPTSEVEGERVDALIVPTARPVHWLRAAATLAKSLDCPLVALCSQSVRSHEVDELGRRFEITTIALDIDNFEGALPEFATSTFVAGSAFQRKSDTSVKRNVALLLSRMVGWKRVLFLDDDIHHVCPDGARSAAGLLGVGPVGDGYTAVGLRNQGYPDNSVVCHVYREFEGAQQQFIGAGALAVSVARTKSFFPNTYNQDWFFLLGDGHPPRVAVTGSMQQKEYDPFADPDRARREELGDCLAEGLYWLLDNGQPLDMADVDHWRRFLERRSSFIKYLIAKTRRDGGQHVRDRWLASLDVAQRAQAHVTAKRCAEYITRWRDDLDAWHKHMADTPSGLGVDEALGLLRAAGSRRRLH